METFVGLAPAQIFSWPGLATLPGFVTMIFGGFLGRLRGPLRRRMHLRSCHLRSGELSAALAHRGARLLRWRTAGHLANPSAAALNAL